MFTGLVAVGFLRLSERALGWIGQADAMFYVVFVYFSLLLVRIALNGMAGEGRGSLLSSRGGSSMDVFSVTLRFLVLWVLWLIPLEMMSLTPEKVMEAFTTLAMQQGGGETIGMTVLAVTLMSLCPPIFLIVSVSSPGFFETFIPSRWVSLFQGRLSHLLLIYAVYLGGVGVIASVLLPLIFVVSIYSELAGKILGWATLVFLCGFAVDLLGRLCGFFVRSEEMEYDSTTETVVPESESEEEYGPDLAPVVAPTSSASVVVPEVYSGEYSNKPRLEDAREQVQNIVEWYDTSPERVLIELEDLRAQYAPNPLVMHSLCVLYHRAGQKDESAAIAREALFVCLERETTRLAADILALHLDRVHEFSLDRDTLLGLAESLKKHHELEKTDAIYRVILEQEPGDPRAIKELLRVAESCLHRNVDLERARQIYTFLLETSDQSPLIKFMRDGLDEVERRLAA
jgi:hypothetical protein